MKLTRRRSFGLLTALLAALVGWRCWKYVFWRPALDPRTISTTLPDTADTRLGRAIRPLAEANPKNSGVFTLPNGRDAFAARSLLADAAERTLDVQYYIWRQDLSGTLLFAALRRAADRGVRVRLLLDDNNTAGLDAILAALDAHPNIEVRLFNPFFRFRRWRILGYLTDFARLNRRMHNKSFTADNQATVIGGRNVGDEYFDAGHDALFVDLDVMAIGPVVNEVSRDFDRYWASGSSYPVAQVLPAVSPDAISSLAAAAARVESGTAASDYLRSLADSPFTGELLTGRLPFEWVVTRVVSDDPAKGLGRATDDLLLWERLKRIVGTPTQKLKLVSAYLVPRAAGSGSLINLAQNRVKVAVLTNALEATDVAAVHAGYAKRRKALLEAGISLYEMRRTWSAPRARERGVGGSSSASSLHAKTFSVDGSRVFIGSFNFDPRSARLNTEIGFIIESPALAQRMEEAIAASLPVRAYAMRLSGAGTLQWVEQREGKEIVHDQEPGTSFRQRLTVSILSRLPIDWLL